MISCSVIGSPAVQRVAAAGRVDVDAGVAGLGPVVRGVVDAAEAQRRTIGAGLGGVVEHHVEHHFQAGPVQRVHHRLELGDLTAGPPGPDGGRVAVVRGEVADRVVAPVVRQAPPEQERLGHVLVHGQQLDGGDAQVEQVRDGGLVGQAGVGPAQLRGNVRVAHGEALDVDLVEDRVRGSGAGSGSRPARRTPESTTRLRGTCAAESRRLGLAGSVSSWPSTSGPNATDPLMALAYGSSSSLAGLHRRPRAGSQGPATR